MVTYRIAHPFYISHILSVVGWDLARAIKCDNLKLNWKRMKRNFLITIFLLGTSMNSFALRNQVHDTDQHQNIKQ